MLMSMLTSTWTVRDPELATAVGPFAVARWLLAALLVLPPQAQAAVVASGVLAAAIAAIPVGVVGCCAMRLAVGATGAFQLLEAYDALDVG